MITQTQLDDRKPKKALSQDGYGCKRL